MHPDDAGFEVVGQRHLFETAMAPEASSAAAPATAKVATYSSPEMRKYISTSPLTPIETEVGKMVDEEQSERQCVKLAELRSHKWRVTLALALTRPGLGTKKGRSPRPLVAQTLQECPGCPACPVAADRAAPILRMSRSRSP